MRCILAIIPFAKARSFGNSFQGVCTEKRRRRRLDDKLASFCKCNWSSTCFESVKNRCLAELLLQLVWQLPEDYLDSILQDYLHLDLPNKKWEEDSSSILYF